MNSPLPLEGELSSARLRAGLRRGTLVADPAAQPRKRDRPLRGGEAQRYFFTGSTAMSITSGNPAMSPRLAAFPSLRSIV